MQEMNSNEIKENKNIIKCIYKQIRRGCRRKICYNIYCNNNLICKESN